jgi:hypothetical protein
MARLLRIESHEAGRRRVLSLNKRMREDALKCESNMSRRNGQHKVWSCLLRGMKTARAPPGVGPGRSTF